MDASVQSPRLSTQVLWLLGAKLIAFSVSLAVPIVLTRAFSLREFGYYKQAFLIVMTACSILPLGVNMSAFYYFWREKEKRTLVVTNILLFNLTVGTVGFICFLAFPRLIVNLVGSEALVGLAPYIGLTILLWICAGFLEVVATANEEVLYSTAFIISAQVTKNLTMIGAALMFHSIRAILIAELIQSGVMLCILHWYLHSRFPGYWRHFDARLFREQLSYAAPLGLAGLVYTLQTDLPNYFVSDGFGPELFAVFSVGMTQLPLNALLRDSVNSVLLGPVSRLQCEQNHRAILDLLFRSARKLALIYWPSTALLLIIGRDLINVVYTSKLDRSWPIFAINLVLLAGNVGMYDPVIRAFATQRFFPLKVRLIQLFVMVGILYFFMHRMGLIGTAILIVLVGVSERIILAVQCVRLLGATIADLKVFRALVPIFVSSVLAGLVAVIARFVVSNLEITVRLLIPSIFFAATYFGALFAQNLLDAEERQIASALIGRIRFGTLPK